MMMLVFRVSGFVYMISCCYLVILAAAQVTHPSEASALLAIKHKLIDSKKHLRNWNTGDPCRSNWTGVLCFHQIGPDGYLHVEEIQLLNMNLSGNLAPELGQLSHLRILDFMWNDLTGTIPKEIGNISTLKLLLLNGNQLSGSLPDELGYLTNLNRLQIDQNYISGPIPKSFANLSSIKHIHLNNNSISGQLPVELSTLSKLIHLLMDNNNLSGYLPPELSNLPQLRIVQLDNNNFDGTEIPAAYGNLSRLAKLSLRNNSLQGLVPDLSQIPNLFYLDLSRNHLSGPIPSKRLSDRMTTIDLSDNSLNGSIPGIFSDLPLLQILSLKNNSLTGSLPANIWQNLSFSRSERLTLDFRNNLLSSIEGDLDLHANISLRLRGNPVCTSANSPGIGAFCGYDTKVDEIPTNTTNSTVVCPIQSCPRDNFFEYVPVSPIPCFCAAPIRIGYRLKSPSFSYFPPHLYSFEDYLTKALELELYQLSIDSFMWEKGPRLRMYLKLFPMVDKAHSSTFNTSEVQRIRKRFTTWDFSGNDFYGPYELLNFTLLGPYSNLNPTAQRAGITGGTLAAIILGAIASAVAISAIVILIIARRHAQSQHILSRRRLSSKISKKIEGVKYFKFKELTAATENFYSSTQVGRGGYGKVYRGVLSDNTIVAIKRAEEGSLQGQKEFLTEIELLSRLHHLNLVSLVGYCDQEEEQMLVYEFMPNGTLRDWLSAKGGKNLSFERRLRIALGSAKGILYLHTEANPPVFHRDIKATNILLDSKLNAKVADFGLSRLAPVLDNEGTLPSHVSTVVKGTPGYLDPEYFLTHKLTDKSDVYSFGVVLLEIITGMQPITHGKNIVREVNMAHESSEMFSIIDSRMGSYPSEWVERFVLLALSCCNDKPECRPSMLDVVRELENILNSVAPTEIESYFTESTSMNSGQSMTSSSSFMNSGQSMTSSSSFGIRDPYLSSGVLDSGLISGVIPTIRPR